MCIAMHILSPMTSGPLWAALVLLQLFAALSIVDGLYLHLWRLRLHARPASYREHLWHTARAGLFAPIVTIVVAVPSAGGLLWLGVGLVAIDLLLGFLDAHDERASRADLGGLGRGEYVLHLALTGLHTAALALALAARPAAAWDPSAPLVVAGAPSRLGWLAGPIVGGALVFALHLGLAWRHRPPRPMPVGAAA